MMKNYEYIIASLPVLESGARTGSGQAPDVEAILGEIREQLDEGDRKALQTVLDGFDSEKLTPAFYAGTLRSKESFIRNYFRFDLNLRNSKVEYLNSALGRREGTDIMVPENAEGYSVGEDYDEKENVTAVLKGSDILVRERGLDDIIWAKVDELTTLHVFDLDLILGFVVKLKIIDRWLKLDPVAGRELFGKLVQEIRNTR